MTRKRNWAAAALVTVGWLLQGGAAQACEGCKQALKNADGSEQLSLASVGYGWSVGFMLIMTFSVLGSLGWMMFRSCQNLARVHAAAESADPADRRDNLR